MPLEASGIIGSLAGIAELVQGAGKAAPVPADRSAGGHE
jgi:hypothetical protein